MMATIAAILTLPTHMQQQRLAEVGPYKSRGKGEGRGNRRPAGAHKAAHRAAMKLRNKKAH